MNHRHTSLALVAAILAALCTTGCTNWAHISAGNKRPMTPEQQTTADNTDKPYSEKDTIYVHFHELESLNQSNTFSTPCFSFDYIANSQTHSGEVRTEESLTTLYIKLLGYARLGHSVAIKPTAKPTAPLAERNLTFSSTSEAEVIAWTRKMIGLGYAVTIDYNKSKQLYTCIATKNK